jgi:hypothetical protein
MNAIIFFILNFIWGNSGYLLYQIHSSHSLPIRLGGEETMRIGV